MRFLWTWTKRLGLSLVVILALLLAPVVYTETICRGDAVAVTGQSLLPPEDWRPESRTLMTYPEWHIVHAYDDYAEVIRTGDPHDFGYFAAIRGFWSSLCKLKTQSASLGEVDGSTKQMVYVIGVSFTAELALKALYEETIGRVTTWLRGTDHTPLDDLSAAQARDYATFLQQVPWYRWRFSEDAQALSDQATDALRDRERRLALGLEYRAKAAYANVIAKAVAEAGGDALTLRMVVVPNGADLSSFKGVEVVEKTSDHTLIETPRYRELTNLLGQMAEAGVNFIEIAGNDQIMFTSLSDQSNPPDALMSLPRQGYGDQRHLRLVRVDELAETLRTLSETGERVEHIHDY